MWRGLMLNRAVQHFLEDVGGATWTTCSSTCRPAPATCRWAWPACCPRAEMIVVTTPARSAQKVAVRAVNMARKSYLRVVGVIENMSDFTCEHGDTYALFGAGGGEELAARRRRAAARPGADRAGGRGRRRRRRTRRARRRSAPPTPFRAIADQLVDESVPPVAMAGCSARMLDAALRARRRGSPPPPDAVVATISRRRSRDLAPTSSGRSRRRWLRAPSRREHRRHRRDAGDGLEPIALVGEARILVVGELEVGGLAVALELLDGARTGDGDDVRTADHPGQRDLRRRGAVRSGDLAQGGDQAQRPLEVLGAGTAGCWREPSPVAGGRRRSGRRAGPARAGCRR